MHLNNTSLSLFLKKITGSNSGAGNKKNKSVNLPPSSELLNTISVAVLLLNKDFGIEYASNAMTALLDAEADELEGRSLDKAFPGQAASIIRQACTEVFENAAARTLEIALSSGRNKKKNLRIELTPHYGAAKKPQSLICKVEDISLQKATQKALQESEDKFRIIAQTSNDIVWHLDKNLCFTYISPTDERIRGFSSREVIGKSFSIFIKPEALQQIKRINALFHKKKNPGAHSASSPIEIEVFCKNGQWIWCELTIIPSYSAEGLFTGYHGIARDITQQKQVEKQIKESEAFRRRVFTSSRTAIGILNADGSRIIDCNPAALELYGFSSKEAFLASSVKNTSPEYQPDRALSSKKARQYLHEAITHGSVVFEWQHQRPEGELWDAEVQLISFQSGGEKYLQYTATDITERKKTVKALEESESRLKLSLKVNNASLFTNNFQTGEAISSPELYQHLGYEIHEIPKTIPEVTRLMHPDDVPGVMDAFASHVSGDKSYYTAEFRIKAKSGEWRWIDGSGKIVERNSNGDPVILLGISRDVSLRKLAEEALKESEKSLNRSQEIAHVGSWIKDEVTGKLTWSDQLYRILGLKVNECKPRFRNFLAQVHPDDKTLVLRAHEQSQQQLLDTSEIEHRILLKRTEEIRFVVQKWVHERDGNGKIIKTAGVIQDITERKKTENQLRKSEESYRLIFEKAPIGVFHLNTNGEITDCNNLFTKITGITAKETDGGNSLVLNNPEIHKRFKDVLRGTHVSWEGNFTAPASGLELPVRVLMSPVINNLGKAEGCIGLIEDRSALLRKAALEKQVAVAKESVKFKQNFLANMSHEIRTPLTGIMGMIEVFEKTGLSNNQLEYLNILKNTSENLMEVINQVLDFSKIEAGKVSLKFSEFTLEELFNSSQKFFGSISHKPVAFQTLIDKNLPRYITADKNRISQVINNLLVNAVKFTDEGKISVTASLEAWKRESSNNGLFEKNTDLVKVRIQVKDTGIGICEEKQKELFTPFAQADQDDRRNSEGTGLGLSICKQLVELHHGEIGMESKTGMGSTFWFTFIARPEAEEKEREKEKSPPDNFSGRSLRILLAEDKKINQKVISLMLSYMGHEVSIAPDGQQAVEMFSPGSFDLILMDIQMPVMDGITATQKLKKLFSNLPPIVGLSANAFEGDREKYMSKGMDEYLTKPVKNEDFKRIFSRLF